LMSAGMSARPDAYAVLSLSHNFLTPPALPGMFVPSLAVGAAGGRLAGRLIAWLVAAAGSKLRVSLAAYSVIGVLLAGHLLGAGVAWL